MGTLLFLFVLVLQLGAPPAEASVRVGGNVLLTPQAGIAANNSPSVTIDPSDPNRVVVVHRVDRPSFSARVEYSRDGGRTWSSGAFPVPHGEGRPFAPDARFGPDGTLYLLFVTLVGPGNSPDVAWLATSSDGGRSFGVPHRVLGAGSGGSVSMGGSADRGGGMSGMGPAGLLPFQARMTVDPTRRPARVWLTWLQVPSDAVHCLGCFTETGFAIMASHSDDGGRSWSKPAQVSAPNLERVGAAVPVVSATGSLDVLYYDFGADSVDWSNGPGRYEGTYRLLLARGTDGRSFDQRVVAAGIRPPDRFLPYIPPFPSLASGRNGSLYAAWTDARYGDWDALFSRSTDGGRTWRAPVRINDDTRGDGRSQYFPALAVTSKGRIDAAFYDRRNDPDNVMTEVYLASSLDEGRTFGQNLPVSDRPFSSVVGPEYPGMGGDFGSRMGLASVGVGALAVWTDTRSGSMASAREDIYAAVVTGLPEVRYSMTAVVTIASAVAGAVAAAAVAVSLVVAARKRRRA